MEEINKEWFEMICKSSTKEIGEDVKSELLLDMIDISLNIMNDIENDVIGLTAKYAAVIQLLERREAYELCNEIRVMFITMMTLGAQITYESITELLTQSIDIYRKIKD